VEHGEAACERADTHPLSGPGPLPGVLVHLSECLLLCLDVESMEGAERDRFLGAFYDHYLLWLLEPLNAPLGGGKREDAGGQEGGGGSDGGKGEEKGWGGAG